MNAAERKFHRATSRKPGLRIARREIEKRATAIELYSEMQQHHMLRVFGQ